MNKDVVYRWEMDAAELGAAKASTDEPLAYSLRESPPIFVAGVPWNLNVITEVVQAQERVTLTLNCMHEDRTTPWSVEQLSNLVLINREASENIEWEFSQPFTHAAPEWSVYITYEEMFDESKGFIIDGIITVEAKVNVKSMNGIRVSLEFDFTQPGVGNDDVVLVIQGRKLHVSKNYLSMHSPYFASLFFNTKFEESEQPEIEIPDCSYNQFVELLYVFYPSYRPLTHWTVRSVLEVADRFDVKYAMNKAEEYLNTTEKVPLATKLILADKFRLRVVMTHCLAKLNTPAKFHKLEEDPDAKKFSTELRSQLYTQLLQASKCRHT